MFRNFACPKPCISQLPGTSMSAQPEASKPSSKNRSGAFAGTGAQSNFQVPLRSRQLADALRSFASASSTEPKGMSVAWPLTWPRSKTAGSSQGTSAAGAAAGRRRRASAPTSIAVRGVVVISASRGAEHTVGAAGASEPVENHVELARRRIGTELDHQEASTVW